MRKSKLTADEIQAAEKAADNRKINRGNGFSLMEIRDRGWARLSNGATMVWPVDEDKRRNGHPDIPPGHFLLVLGNHGTHLFNAEDFQRYMRWI